MNLVSNYKYILIIFFVAATAMDALAQGRCVVTYRSMNSEVKVRAYVPEAVDEQPQFPGGDNALMRYINQERRYPRDAYCAGIEGRVLCSFIVDSDGSVSNVEVLRGVDESLNREAVRIISGMPRWKAGTIDGGNVPVYYVLSIPFRR